MDGSLSARFKQPLLDGKVFAKTGTLGEARALSGYLTAASGQTVAFSIMCTDHRPSAPADRMAMDKIVSGDRGVELRDYRCCFSTLALLSALGCHHLTPSQAAERAHAAGSRRLSGLRKPLLQLPLCQRGEGLNGPGLEGLFRKPYLPSGMSGE